MHYHDTKIVFVFLQRIDFLPDHHTLGIQRAAKSIKTNVNHIVFKQK